MKQNDSKTDKAKESEMQLHILQSSLSNLQREEQTFMMRF
jgi:hypothetical protein